MPTNTQKKGITYYLEMIADAIHDLAIGRFVQADWSESDNESPAFIQNKPVVPIIVTVQDITALTAEQLEALDAGDIVIKQDETGKHSYRVNFKGEGGLCLTYCDCENVETVAYNKAGNAWTYDDTTVTPIGG